MVEGSSFTSAVAPAGTVTGVSNATVPKCPRKVPLTAAVPELRKVAWTVRSALLVSGSGSLLDTKGFSMVTAPDWSR